MIVLRDLAMGCCGLLAFLSGMSALLCFARWGNEHKMRILSAALAVWAIMLAGTIYIRVSDNEIVRAFFNEPWKEVCSAVFVIYFWVPIFAIKIGKEELDKHLRSGEITLARFWIYFAGWIMWVILVIGIIYIRVSDNGTVRAFFNEPWKEVCYALFAFYSLFPVVVIMERKKIFRHRPAEEGFGVNPL